MTLKGLSVEQMTQIFLEGKIVKVWPKNLFFVSFCKFFFLYALLHPMNYNRRFCQMKGLNKIYICGKFHQYSLCGSEIKNFQSFLY